MAIYDSKAPGVYIEEISGGARPIQAVGTSTAGFVGEIPYPDPGEGRAIAVNNWMEFVRRFKLEKLAESAKGRSPDIVQAVYGFFLNGGTRCYVAAVGSGAASGDGSGGTEPQESTPEATDPEGTDLEATEGADPPATESTDPPVPEGADPPPPEAASGNTPGAGDDARIVALREGLGWLAKRDEIAIVAAPGYTGDAYDQVISHCKTLRDRVAILDSLEKVADTATLTDSSPDGLRPPDSAYATFYYPWIVVRDPFSGETVQVAPSGHIAGVWARTDAERGVHKAPANTPIRGAVGLVDLVADDEQGLLNQNGVNCIRSFSSGGILIWGARTLATVSEPEWRYLNVRRLVNMIEESIEESTRWAVFEPNDTTLWAALRRDVSAFLTRIWRTGALRGVTPEQAFFVKCDEETNPTEEIDAGVVRTVVGVAPVKPAEFVVFEIRQYQPGSDVEAQGG